MHTKVAYLPLENHVAYAKVRLNQQDDSPQREQAQRESLFSPTCFQNMLELAKMYVQIPAGNAHSPEQTCYDIG